MAFITSTGTCRRADLRSFLNGSVVGLYHALMTCWNFLCGPASSEIPARRRQHQEDHRCRLGYGIRIGTRSAAGGLAEVSAPNIETVRRVSSAKSLAPHNVISGVNFPVEIEV